MFLQKLIFKAISASLLTAPLVAMAATGYPEKAVRIVVVYPAGGAVDPPARLLAQQLTDQLKQSFFVDNRPGAGGNIGTDAVVSASPDGYTLLITGPNITIAPALLPQTTHYDPNTSFTHIARILTMPTVIVVNKKSPFKSFPELLNYARLNPGKLTYGSPGTRSPSQLAMELILQMAGVSMLHVPYKGAAPAMTDVLGGQIDVLVTTAAGPMEHIKSGNLRALAISSAKREPQLPDVQSVAETLPGFDSATWIGLSGPKGMSAEVAGKLSAGVEEALKNPNVKARLLEGGTTPAYLNEAGLAAEIQAETKLYAQVIKDRGLTTN